MARWQVHADGHRVGFLRQSGGGVDPDPGRGEFGRPNPIAAAAVDQRPDLYRKPDQEHHELTRVPDALRHSSCRCAEPGPYQAPEFATSPALQRTASQLLRAALRPGHRGVSTSFTL